MNMTPLQQAAQAVIDRWDSPLWKDLPATARYMHDLCEALNEPDRVETEYQAATLRIDNDLMVIAALTAERDAYAKAANDMAAAHKVERDALKDAARLASKALNRIDAADIRLDVGERLSIAKAIAALKAVL